MQMVFSMAVLSALLAVVSCTLAASDYSPDDIIALERGALDRWGKGDPEGFLELMSEDETYFDPMTEKRIDGREALRKYFAPFVGKIRIERVEIMDPKVQRQRDLAVLTFNLADYGAQFDFGPKSHGPVELHGGLPEDRRKVEDCAFTLVVHQARAKDRRVGTQRS